MSTGGTVDIKPDVPDEDIQVTTDAGVLNADPHTNPPEDGICQMRAITRADSKIVFRCDRCVFSDLREREAELQQAACGCKQPA